MEILETKSSHYYRMVLEHAGSAFLSSELDRRGLYSAPIHAMRLHDTVLGRIRRENERFE